MFFLARDTIRRPHHSGDVCDLFCGRPDLIDGKFEQSETSEHLGAISCRSLADRGIFIDPGESLEFELSVEDIVSAFWMCEPAGAI